MNKLLRLLLLAGLVVLAIWAWRTFSRDPKTIVRRQLEKIARLASFPPNTGNLSRVAEVQRLGRLFAEDAQVTLDAPGVEAHTFNGRAELMQAAMVAKSLGNGLKVEFLDMNIEMGEGAKSALVDLTLKARIGGENDIIAQELKFTLKLIDGEWLVTRVESVPTLKP